MVKPSEFKSQAFKARMYTKWVSPTARMDTQWGIITNKEWCEREVLRLNDKSGPRAELVVRHGGHICVVYDTPTQSGDQNVN